MCVCDQLCWQDGSVVKWISRRSYATCVTAESHGNDYNKVNYIINAETIPYSVKRVCKYIIIITSPPRVIWEEGVALAQLCNKSPLVTMVRPKFTPKTAPSLRRSPPPSNTPTARPSQLTNQTASGSNQPFCHSTLSGQTDSPTHTDRQMG